MLDSVVAVLGAVLLLLGLALATVGLYGMLRKPSIFEQLHAAALVTGPGVILVLLASLATGNAETTTSALLVVAFVLVTSSLSTHAIALAAWRQREAAAGSTAGSRRMVAAEGLPGGAAARTAMRVLVAHDGSSAGETAVRLVSEMRWPDGSVIRVMGAIEGDLPRLATDAPRVNDEPLELAAALEGAERLLVRPGLTVDRVVRRGAAAEAIVEEAVAYGAELLVVGSRGLGRVRSVLVGSVAAEVTDGAPCPVLVARSTRLRDVLLAVDGSDASAAATDAVARWPIFEGTRTHVLSVARAREEASGVSPSRDTGGTIESGGHRQVADRAARRLHEAGRSAVAHVLPGDPAMAILAFAETEAIDMVVLGTRGHTGLRRAILGSVARDVLSSTRTSVLVVRARDS